MGVWLDELNNATDRDWSSAMRGITNRTVIPMWVSIGGRCVLVTGLHLRLADIAECFAQDAYVKGVKRAFMGVAPAYFSYAELTGHRGSGTLTQQEHISILYPSGSTTYPFICQRVSIAPSIFACPPSIRRAHYPTDERHTAGS